MPMSPYCDQSLLSDSAENESGLKWTVLKVDGHVKLGGPSKNGRSQSKLDGYLNLSGHSRTILNGLSTQKFGAIP